MRERTVDLLAENFDLRRALGAVKIRVMQRDLAGAAEELAGYEVEFVDGEPVVPPRRRAGAAS